MPSLAQSSDWFVRVTQPHDVLKQIGLPKWIDLSQAFAVLHIAKVNKAEHGHYLIRLSSVIQKQAMMKRVDKWFKDHGIVLERQHKSVKVWDGQQVDSAPQYVFDPRSQPVLMEVKGFTDEYIQQCREGADRYAASQEARPGSDKPTQNQVINMIAEYVAEMDCSDVSVQGQIKYYDEVTRIAIRHMNKYEMPFSEFSIKKIIDTALARAQGEHLDRLAARIVNSYVRYLT